MTNQAKPNTVARIIESLDWQLEASAKDIQDFTDKLGLDAAHALEWYADQALLAAVNIEHLTRIKLTLDAWTKMPDDVKVLDQLGHYFVQQLRESRLNGSTGNSHRAGAIARTENATSLWFDRSSFTRLLRDQIEQALGAV